MLVITLFSGQAGHSAPVANSDAVEWSLACRLGCYGKFQDTAWTHLPSIGVHGVFFEVPKPDDEAAVQKRLDEYHLKAPVLGGHSDLAKPGYLDELATQLETCERMGAHYLFLSPRHEGLQRDVVYERLRHAGDLARQHGVTIMLETHPDLGTNGDVQLETMKRVDHPNVRVNFDTGNITYYNHDTDAVAELKKIIDYVATVELKDHGGQFKAWDFPALGRGKTNFAGVFQVLKDHGFNGPFTIEIEGVAGESWDEAKTKQFIADSVTYLRSLASFK